MQSEEKTNDYTLRMLGTGSEYFGILIVNALLTIVTLGFYYPWARAKSRRFTYGSFELNGSRFFFSGTGKEMFIGMLKVTLFYLIIYGLMFFLAYFAHPLIAYFVFIALFVLIVPLMIHGAWRYRMSRTSWRGIRFGYYGSRKKLFGKYLLWFFLSTITLGIYSPWATMNLRKYLHDNLCFGDAECQYDGNGVDFFLLNLKGGLLTLITFGVYSFWWQKDLFAYYVNNISFHRNNEMLWLDSKATAGGFFKLTVINMLLVVFTLGLGTAWAEVRSLRFIADNVRIQGNLDLSTLQQIADEYDKATGDIANDFFDLDLF